MNIYNANGNPADKPTLPVTPMSARGTILTELVLVLGPILQKALLAWLATLAILCMVTATSGEEPCQVHVTSDGTTRHCGLQALPPFTRNALQEQRRHWPRPQPQPQPQPQPEPIPQQTIDFSAAANAVEDQDGQNSCAPHAACHCFRTVELMSGAADPRSAVSDLYQRVNGGRDAGADLNACAFQLSASGVCSLDFAPELGVRGVTEKDGFLADRAKHRQQPAAQFIGTEAELVRELEAKHPCLIGVIVRSDFQPGDDAYIPAPRGFEEGGHALMACGIRPHGSSWDVKIQNSWGSKWGANGYAWLDHRWLDIGTFGAFSFAPAPRLDPPAGSEVSQFWQEPSPCASGQCPRLPQADIAPSPCASGHCPNVRWGRR